MTSAEIAAQLLEFTETWDVASVVLGFPGTETFNVVYTFVGEEPPSSRSNYRSNPSSAIRMKSVNELSSEISTFTSCDYVPIGLIVWREYAPQQLQFMTQIFP